MSSDRALGEKTHGLIDLFLTNDKVVSTLFECKAAVEGTEIPGSLGPKKRIIESQ